MPSTVTSTAIYPDITVGGVAHPYSPDGEAYVRAELERLDEISRSAGFTNYTGTQLARIADGISYVNQCEAYRRLEDAYRASGGSPAAPSGPRFGAPNQIVSRAVWEGIDLNQLGPDQMIDRARRALDATHRRNVEDARDEAFERAERMIGNRREATRASAWAIAASDPAYESAFEKMLRDVTRGHLEWTDAERLSFARVQEISRAMSLTDANGGYMVPFTLDPAIMLTSDGSVNPLRSLARVESTTTNQWQGVTSAGVTATWRPETEESTDDAPTVDDAPINVHTGDAFVPFSYEWGMDARDPLGELRRLLVDAADQLMATAYTVGTGDANDQPTGFVTALDGTASELSPAVAETFADTDVYTTLEAVPPRFRPRAAWMAELSTLNAMAQFETGNGARLFPELADGRLLMRRIEENSLLDPVSGINTAATADNFVLAVGDWRAGFVIVDRIGTTVELLPYLVGANGRPTRQRGLHLWFRTGSGVVNAAALRVLNVATTA